MTTQEMLNEISPSVDYWWPIFVDKLREDYETRNRFWMGPWLCSSTPVDATPTTPDRVLSNYPDYPNWLFWGLVPDKVRCNVRVDAWCDEGGYHAAAVFEAKHSSGSIFRRKLRLGEVGGTEDSGWQQIN